MSGHIDSTLSALGQVLSIRHTCRSKKTSVVRDCFETDPLKHLFFNILHIVIYEAERDAGALYRSGLEGSEHARR
ncbi:hypothetical protein BN2476_470073 [Paraburkholderia piptadeniae]|uniref:Uncharacterized protein n=1 Tax=Paraburkholderia piptadeniae TaxID=1701573 RepID=A0A1N7SE40_9BURK|nr:hypothetical protein BN2476_470073 [Paraburkholderia piptadeniae]